MHKIVVEWTHKPVGIKLTIKQKFFFTRLLLLAVFIKHADATNGYFLMGPENKVATARAGVSQGTDATDAHTNPALLNRTESNLFLAMGIFHPERFMDTSNATTPPRAGFPQTGNPAGQKWSRKENFPDGSLGVAFNRKIWSFGLSLTGSGGIVTDYPTSRLNPLLLQGQNYDTSVVYRIFNITPAVAFLTAKDRLSIGFAPIFSYSNFKADSAVANF